MRTPYLPLLLLWLPALPAFAANSSSFAIDGNVALGALAPEGSQTSGGMVVRAGTRADWNSMSRAVLIFGEINGEFLNNSSDPSQQTVKLSQIYVNAGLAVGNDDVKWRLPVNFAVSKDIVANEFLTFRWAVSGIYLKLIDDTPQSRDQAKQLLEVIGDVVVAHIQYNDQAMSNPCPPPPPPTKPGDPTTSTSENCGYGPTNSGYTMLGLYSAIRYQIEKNGWGANLKAELLQDASPHYTKISADAIGYRQLSGKLSNLRSYVQVGGMLDHDANNPDGAFSGAVRVLGGLSGRFDF